MNIYVKLLLVVIVVMLGVIGYGYVKINGYDALYSEQQEIISEKDIAYAGLIDKWIQDKKSLVRHWANDSFYKTVFTSANGKFYVTKELVNLQQSFDYYKVIAIADAAGKIIVSSDSSFPLESIQNDEYFKIAMEGTEPDPQIIDNDDCKIITVASPISLDGTYPIGVMIAVIKL